MMTPEDLELEALLAELAPTPEARAKLAEEHRQLEKDLLRLADPLPPPDFVHAVMARVANAPARAPNKREVAVAAGIILAAVGLSVVGFATHHDGFAGFGIEFTQAVLRVRDTVIGLGSALQALWRTAALPLTIGLGATLAACLVAFKRVVFNGLTQVKVVS